MESARFKLKSQYVPAMPTMSLVRRRIVPSAKNRADKKPTLEPRMLRNVVSSMAVAYFFNEKITMAAMTAMPIAIRGQSAPAITATMIDGSQPRPTPSKKPYSAMQYIHEPINTMNAVIANPIWYELSSWPAISLPPNAKLMGVLPDDNDKRKNE